MPACARPSLPAPTHAAGLAAGDLLPLLPATTCPSLRPFEVRLRCPPGALCQEHLLRRAVRVPNLIEPVQDADRVTRIHHPRTCAHSPTPNVCSISGQSASTGRHFSRVIATSPRFRSTWPVARHAPAPRHTHAGPPATPAAQDGCAPCPSYTRQTAPPAGGRVPGRGSLPDSGDCRGRGTLSNGATGPVQVPRSESLALARRSRRQALQFHLPGRSFLQ